MVTTAKGMRKIVDEEHRRTDARGCRSRYGLAGGDHDSQQ
jgi:hypothetical protein